jgi:ABC-2 type transport system ATP-binding protein
MSPATGTTPSSKVGAIFETPIFYDYLSGRRNLEILATYTAPTLGRANPPRSPNGSDSRGREDSKVRTYSHGMRARLALAQALLPKPPNSSSSTNPPTVSIPRASTRCARPSDDSTGNLGLTILLSSHLLSEVEQLCSRIAVIHGGRKVFDGSIEEATRGRNRVRLHTEPFLAAVFELSRVGLIQGSDEPGFVTLSAGHTPSEIVKHLVDLGFPIHAIAPEESSLEQFYLSLVKKSPASS